MIYVYFFARRLVLLDFFSNGFFIDGFLLLFLPPILVDAFDNFDIFVLGDSTSYIDVIDPRDDALDGGPECNDCALDGGPDDRSLSIDVIDPSDDALDGALGDEDNGISVNSNNIDASSACKSATSCDCATCGDCAICCRFTGCVFSLKRFIKFVIFFNTF